MPPKMLTTRQFRDALAESGEHDYDLATIQRWCERGLIPGARRLGAGTWWRIPESSVDQMLDKLRRSP